jgi:quercetin dioxygenase-like cupin family protein
VSERFPDFIRALPQPDSPIPGLRAWMIQSPGGIAMFYELPDGAEVAEHAHGAQWGVVLAGTVEFTIGAETRGYGPGETYSIEAGVRHSARISPGFAGIDVFADADRYSARE